MTAYRAFRFCVLCLAGTAGCLDPTGALVPRAKTTPPPPTFDESGSFAWRVVWGMSQAEFARNVRTLKRQGYRPHDLEVYRYEDQTRFAGIFLKDPRAWQARWRRTRSAFDADFRLLRDRGYQPIDLEVINERGALRYSSVWIENPGGPAWRARWDLTHEQLLDELEEYRRKGYRPTDLEIYDIGGKTRYAYVMIHDPRGADCEALWHKAAETMKRELRSLVSRGYRVVALEGSTVHGELRWSAIFSKDRRMRDSTFTVCRSSGQIHRAIRDLGSRYRPIHFGVTRHKEGGYQYFWVWQRN